MQVAPELLSLAARLRLVAPRAARGARQGDRRGMATGQGQEFADHRPYHDGDDLRRVDWGAYERLESLLIRLSHEDRDQRVLLLLDVTGSMALDRKADHAADLAVGLALAGLLSRDQIHLGLLGPAPRLLVGEDARALPAMLRLLEEATPGGSAPARELVRAWSRSRRFDQAILLSDLLLEPDEAEQTLAALAAAGERAALLHVLSPADIDPDLRGTLELEDAESGERLLLEASPGTAEAYREVFVRWHRGLVGVCRRLGIQLVETPTATPPVALLAGALRQAGLVTGRQGGSGGGT